MSLGNVLANLTLSRDNFVTALTNKGVTVSANATINQCISLISQINTSDSDIPISTPSTNGNIVSIPAGRISEATSVTIGTAIAGGTITPGTTSNTNYVAGSYLISDLVIAGSDQLIAGNIKSGVTIFGVTGTYSGGSGSSASTEYYKCTQVTPGTSTNAIKIENAEDGDCDGDYIDTGDTYFDWPVYSFTNQTSGNKYYIIKCYSYVLLTDANTYENNDIATMIDNEGPSVASKYFIYFDSSTDEIFSNPWTIAYDYDNSALSASQTTIQDPGFISGQRVLISNGSITLDQNITSGIGDNGITPSVGTFYAVSNNQIIGSEPNLTAENIALGVSVFGITGTHRGGDDVTLGVVDEDGKFQAFSFNGKTPLNSGEPETVTNYKTWNSTLPPPNIGGGGSSENSAVYLCKSTSDSIVFNLIGDTYGGTYVYDGTIDDGYYVYTNGTYYVIHRNETVDRGTTSQRDWSLYSSREYGTPISTESFSLLEQFVTTDGKVLVWKPETISSGTWIGREMIRNNAGYYEPVDVDVETELTWTNISPVVGEMYTKTGNHVDEIWSYNYKRDIKSLYSSVSDELHSDTYVDSNNVSGPDENGWFSVSGSEAHISYSGENMDYGTSYYTAKANNFTISFKFKTGTNIDGVIIRIGSETQVRIIDGKLNIDRRCHGWNSMILQTIFDGTSEVMSFEFQENTEYNIVMTCDASRFRIIINNILVVNVPSLNSSENITSIMLNSYEDDHDSHYYYKEFSMWGRVLNELTSFTSTDFEYSECTINSNIAATDHVTFTNPHITSTGRLIVYGDSVVENATIDSSNENKGLFVLSGGNVNSCTVSSGGRLVVYSGGTATNVVAEDGAVIVNAGGTITYTQGE